MTADRPYTDDDLDRAAEAIDLDLANEAVPYVFAPSLARAVLDAVASDIDKRAEERGEERARESIVAWLRAECDRLHSESLDMRLDMDASTRMHARSMAVGKAANAIEAHVDREDDR